MRDEFGITAFGHRVRILKEIQALLQSRGGEPDSTALAPIPASHQQPSPSGAAAPSANRVDSLAPPPPQPPPAAATAQPVYDQNSLHLVVLHAAPLVIKDSKGRIYPMEKLDLEAERRAITNSLLTDVQHKAIHVRFDNATADILRSLMTAWTCKVRDMDISSVFGGSVLMVFSSSGGFLLLL